MGSNKRSLSERVEKHLLRAVVKTFRPWARTKTFGPIEALAYGSEVDHWMRYAPVLEQIKTYLAQATGKERITILDVGGGPAGLASLLRDRRIRLVAIDPNERALRGNRALKIVGDGCRLPFADRTIDLVVSVDSLEHVPAPRRREFLLELKRVARGPILIHCPIDSADGAFQGTRYDRLFQRLHRRVFGGEEANTAEHLQCGLPTVELVRSVFPHATVRGLQHGPIWLQHMMGGRRRWVRMVNGMCYLKKFRADDHRPPFHGALFVIDPIQEQPSTNGSGRTTSSSQQRATVSAVVLTKNEESRIARCLTSLQWMDDVVIVDGHSRDRTVEICRRFNARVIQRAFSGSFAGERNAGLEAATSEWVLQLDADDVVTPGMRHAVEGMLQRDDPRYDVYTFRRRSIFLGHRLMSGGWAPAVPHFVRRRAARYVGLVHEHPEAPGLVGALDAEIDHYFCDQFADLVDKLNRYSTLAVQELCEGPSRLSSRALWSKVVGRPAKLFWKIYLKKQGYRDGLPGLVMAMHNSWSHVIIVAKWWEACRPSHGRSTTLTDRLKDLNASSSAFARQRWQRGDRFSTAHLVTRLWVSPVIAFLRAYVFGGAMLNGWEGFFDSACSGYGQFISWVKCWELMDQRNGVLRAAT